MIYFDHNASTPVRPEARDAMSAALADLHGNPSSLHRDGQLARAAVERAREQVAALVHSRPDEVIFVSGGTEGDHAGWIGLALAASARGRTVAFGAIEHHAVHGAADVLETLGFHSAHLPVDERGVARLEAMAELPGDTIGLALMLANNETGVLQPVAEAAAIARRSGWSIHCDAVQAAGKVPVDFESLGVDTLVISAHKLGGPKGAGALILRRGTPWQPLFRGSAHERGRRGGTENVAGIVGFGVAAELAGRELASEPSRMLALRERFERGLGALNAGVVIHGAGADRLPNTINASFPGARSDHLLMALDARGIAVSAGAACASGAVEASPVLSAMGVPRDLAICALRFSMGRTTTPDEVERVLVAVKESIAAARAMTLSGARA
jgi:cysteine desulfurase